MEDSIKTVAQTVYSPWKKRFISISIISHHTTPLNISADCIQKATSLHRNCSWSWYCDSGNNYFWGIQLGLKVGSRGHCSVSLSHMGRRVKLKSLTHLGDILCSEGKASLCHTLSPYRWMKMEHFLCRLLHSAEMTFTADLIIIVTEA